MGLKTTATCVYTATATGITVTALASAMDKTIVPVDQDFLNLMALSVTSDTTGSAGPLVTRTIVLALNVPTFISAFGSNPAPPGVPPGIQWTGTIHSRSAKDTSGGLGARTVTVNYLDAASGAQTEGPITLQGTTKVLLTKANYCQITSITLNTVGADGANDGDIIITRTTGLATNAPLVIGYIPASFYTKCIPQGVQQASMIGPWMQLPLQGRLGIPVTPVLPVTFA
jgi:hypothetical protein